MSTTNKKQELIINLELLLNKEIIIKFISNKLQDVKGKLLGYDQLMNLTIDSNNELIVIRGLQIGYISSTQDYIQIDNPFI